MKHDRSMLNSRLIEIQELSDEDVTRICALHDQLDVLFEQMADMDPKKSQRQLLICVEKIEQLEFDLQAAWKFEQNKNYHTWWYQAPHCICPRMDNADVVGTELRYFISSCPLHGAPTWISEKDLVEL